MFVHVSRTSAGVYLARGWIRCTVPQFLPEKRERLVDTTGPRVHRGITGRRRYEAQTRGVRDSWLPRVARADYDGCSRCSALQTFPRIFGYSDVSRAFFCRLAESSSFTRDQFLIQIGWRWFWKYLKIYWKNHVVEDYWKLKNIARYKDSAWRTGRGRLNIWKKFLTFIPILKFDSNSWRFKSKFPLVTTDDAYPCFFSIPTLRLFFFITSSFSRDMNSSNWNHQFFADFQFFYFFQFTDGSDGTSAQVFFGSPRSPRCKTKEEDRAMRATWYTARFELLISCAANRVIRKRAHDFSSARLRPTGPVSDFFFIKLPDAFPYRAASASPILTVLLLTENYLFAFSEAHRFVICQLHKFNVLPVRGHLHIFYNMCKL